MKNNRARFVTLTPRLQALILARKADEVKPDDLVFSSPQGKAIDDHNFRNRAWKSVLEKAGVEYRKPHTTRSTLISHALDMGMNPVMIAEMTGHEVQTLFREYAGNVQGRPRLAHKLKPNATRSLHAFRLPLVQATMASVKGQVTCWRRYEQAPNNKSEAP